MISLEQVRALEDRVEKAVAYIASLTGGGRRAQAPSGRCPVFYRRGGQGAGGGRGEGRSGRKARRCRRGVAPGRRIRGGGAHTRARIAAFRYGRARCGGRDPGRRPKRSRGGISAGSGENRRRHRACPPEARLLRGSRSRAGLGFRGWTREDRHGRCLALRGTRESTSRSRPKSKPGRARTSWTFSSERAAQWRSSFSTSI